MSKAERILDFENDIIDGIIVKELQSVFKELNESFKQRKTYDEYYYTTTKVSLSMPQIIKLNELYYSVKIDYEYMTITF